MVRRTRSNRRNRRRTQRGGSAPKYLPNIDAVIRELDELDLNYTSGITPGIKLQTGGVRITRPLFISLIQEIRSSKNIILHAIQRQITLDNISTIHDVVEEQQLLHIIRQRQFNALNLPELGENINSPETPEETMHRKMRNLLSVFDSKIRALLESLEKRLDLLLS